MTIERGILRWNMGVSDEELRSLEGVYNSSLQPFDLINSQLREPVSRYCAEVKKERRTERLFFYAPLMPITIL